MDGAPPTNGLTKPAAAIVGIKIVSLLSAYSILTGI